MMGIVQVFHHGPLEASPLIRVGTELLFGVLPQWEVDLTTAECPVINTSNPQFHGTPPTALLGARFPLCEPPCLKGTRIIHKIQDRQLIWILTGEHDYQTDLFDARWPD